MNSLGELYTPAEDLYKKYRKHTLQLELTDICNLNCPLCNQGMSSENVHDIKKGFMSEVFWKILDDIEKSRMKFFELQLFWFGEPLVHPKFKKFFQVLMLLIHQKQIFGQIDIHTNAVLMNKEISDMFLLAEAKLPCITLSLDAITKDSYNNIRVGGDFKKVMDNIHYFIKRREKLGQILPTLRFQYILHNKNADEAKAFNEYWKEYLKCNTRKNEFFKEIIEYCEKGSFRKKYISDIDHPIYPHEIYKYNLYKKLSVHKDTIWFKRPNILPLEKQYEFDKFYEDQIKKYNLITEENICSKTIAEVSNDIFNIETEVIENNLEFNDKEILPENIHKEEIEAIEVNENNYINESETLKCFRRPCISLFCKPVIRWDGILTVCCNDPKGQMSLGSIYENSFDDLWFSEKMNKFREIHIKGEFDKLPLCKNCRNFDGDQLTDKEILDFCNEFGLLELADIYKKRLNLI